MCDATSPIKDISGYLLSMVTLKDDGISLILFAHYSLNEAIIFNDRYQIRCIIGNMYQSSAHNVQFLTFFQIGLIDW